MTKNQVAAWAQASVKADTPELTRVVVANVLVTDGCVQKVRFLHRKEKHVIVARTKGFSPIRIRMEESGKFLATAMGGEVHVTSATAAKAFGHAAKEAWVN